MDEIFYLWKVVYKLPRWVFVRFNEKYSENDIRYREVENKIVKEEYYVKGLCIRDVILDFYNSDDKKESISFNVYKIDEFEKVKDVKPCENYVKES